jgi:hypothetical protein
MTGLLDIFNYGTGNDFLNEKKKEIERLERGSLYRAGGGDAQNTWRSGDQSQQVGTFGKIKDWYLGGTGKKPTTRRKPEGYYERQQKLMEEKYRTIPVAGGKVDMTIDRKTGNVVNPSLPMQVPPGVKAPTISGKTSDGRKSDGMDLSQWHGNNQQEQLKWWQTLANKAGIDFSKAAASWKEKGGFEGLMSNPAFTMGLAFMQAGAEGKTLGAGALDNVMKAGGISMHYKKIIEDRAGDPVTEVTTGQMDSIKGVLGSVGISGPILRKMKPGNQAESYEQAVEDIAFKVQKKVNDMKKAAKKSGRKIEVGTRLYKKIVDDMIASKEINKVGGFNLFGYNIWDATLEAKAQGGPVQAGKPYIVGEQGPEVIIPNASGNVLSNDNSQIFAMLLAANPQLQQVSRTRSEKILRNRFPEYFE